MFEPSTTTWWDDIADQSTIKVRVRARRPDGGGHRPPAAPHPQRVRERRHASSRATRSRSVDLLRAYLEGRGVDLETLRAAARAQSLVARIEGTDPDAPTLLLMGHTDVVPVNPDGWRRDPFGGELVDGEVWGRGAVDMLNLTASMAVAFKRLADERLPAQGHAGLPRRRRRGGARHVRRRVSSSTHERDAVQRRLRHHRVRRHPDPDARRGSSCPVIVGEKGTYWCTLRVSGTPGHGSQPFRTDNALVTAAEVVRRIAEYQPADADPRRLAPVRRGAWSYARRAHRRRCSTPTASPRCCDGAAARHRAASAHACTHTTFAPTVVHGGTKTNVIPDRVELEVDIRTLPGQTERRGRAHCSTTRSATSPTRSRSSVATTTRRPRHPIDTPLWDALRARDRRRSTQGSTTVPFLTVGATDARFFRRAGATSYGFGLFSSRIDVRGLRHRCSTATTSGSTRSRCGLSTELWEAVARDLLGVTPRTAPVIPGRAVRLRRRHPLEPVRGLRPATSEANGLPEGLHPPPQRHQPRHQRLGAARAQRGRASTSSATCSRPRPWPLGARGRRPRGACRCSPARSARRWSRPSGGARERLEHGVPHEQLRRLRRSEGGADDGRSDVMALFDAVIESSKVGVRKPDPRFYELACDALGIDAGRGGVPRRPRRQPQARARPWA